MKLNREVNQCCSISGFLRQNLDLIQNARERRCGILRRDAWHNLINIFKNFIPL